ncbi:hypothetical protein ACWCXH_25595 [Kitasatospora sp. NPDC001660]
MRIRILWPAGQATATLRATPTAEALRAELPIGSSAGTWGEEDVRAFADDAAGAIAAEQGMHAEFMTAFGGSAEQPPTNRCCPPPGRATRSASSGPEPGPDGSGAGTGRA